MRIVIPVILMLMSGCATYTYNWKPVPPDIHKKVKNLVNATITNNTFETLKDILLENNLAIRLLEAKIEISKHSSKNIKDHLPGLSASYDILDANPSLSVNKLLQPIITAILDDTNTSTEVMKCQLHALKHTFVDQLSKQLDNLNNSRIKLLPLKNQLADKQAWYLYYRFLHENELLTNWEDKIKAVKYRVEEAQKEIFDMKTYIVQIKRKIFFICGAVKLPESSDD